MAVSYICFWCSKPTTNPITAHFERGGGPFCSVACVKKWLNMIEWLDYAKKYAQSLKDGEKPFAWDSVCPRCGTKSIFRGHGYWCLACGGFVPYHDGDDVRAGQYALYRDMVVWVSNIGGIEGKALVGFNLDGPGINPPKVKWVDRTMLSIRRNEHMGVTD